MAKYLELLENFTSPVRQTGAKISFTNDTETITLTEKDYLKSANVERVGNSSKFFGYGICQKLNIKALDIERQFNFTTSHKGQLSFSVNNGAYNVATPTFYITETNRDEISGELSITGYDLLKNATNYTVAELGLVAPYTIKDVVTAIGAKLGAIDTVVFEKKNLAKPVEEWTLSNGAYIDEEGYIVLPNETSLAYIDIDWNKRSNRYALSAITDSTEANYSVYTALAYLDENGIQFNGNGDVEHNLNGEYNYSYIRYPDNTVYAEAIGKATKIRVMIARSTTYAKLPYRFKQVMFSRLYIPFEEYQETAFNTYYESGANFDGAETLQEVLIAAAEATQSIYYINTDNELIFKRFDINGEALVEISKEEYFSLDSGANRRLTKIASVTELGDNVLAELEVSGSIQYVRNNPFWEMREDIGSLVNDALAEIGGLTINQFNCKWRGFPFIEIGDKISLTTKDGGAVVSYILNDVIEYTGALSQNTEWSYTDNDGETATNPSNLGEAIKKTYARVDKANKEIELLASEVGANSEALATLRIDTDNINASVTKIQENTDKELEDTSNEITTLKSQVEAKMSAEDVTLAITKELENGTTKVITKTGFTFDDDGLTVEKSNSEMKTQITEDGMKVFKDNEEVLTANNVGVNAKNLHATTYLIIGTNSRFEDYGSNRTGCFWVGGAN